MARVSPKSKRKRFEDVPPYRGAAAAPAQRVLPRVPKGGPPKQHVPAAHVSQAPKPHAVGAPPNPRKPQLVRDVHGNELKDLFEMFPDLPRPARPVARVPLRVRRGRR